MNNAPRMDNSFYSMHTLITGRYQEQPFPTWMDALADAIADDATDVPAPFAPLFPRY